PIGSILSPNLDLKAYSSLPFASTLCGSCTDVCPVKINIHEQLFNWRQVITEAHGQSPSKRLIMKAAGRLCAKPGRCRVVARGARPLSPSVPAAIASWGTARERPPIANVTFRDWYMNTVQKNE